MVNWVESEDYPGYWVSRHGEIRSPRGNLVGGELHKGYLRFARRVGGRRKRVMVHRMVAKAYLPRVKGKSQINHKNGDKTDNRAENLEWCTSLENIRHAIDTGLKPVIKAYSATVVHDEKLGMGLVLFGRQEIEAAGYDVTTVSNCIHRPETFKSHRGKKIFKVKLDSPVLSEGVA